MLESTSRLLFLVEHVAPHLMQQPEGQRHRPPNQWNKKFFDVDMRDSKTCSYWRMRVYVSVQKAYLYLDLITPFHSHQYPPPDLYHHIHTKHCAVILDSQSTKIRPLTTSSRAAFPFLSTL